MPKLIIHYKRDLPISEEAKVLAETLFLPLFLAEVITHVFVNRMWTKQASKPKQSKNAKSMTDLMKSINKPEHSK